jgi:hypothetical protein
MIDRTNFWRDLGATHELLPALLHAVLQQLPEPLLHLALDPEFGRIVVSETELPNLLVDLV